MSVVPEILEANEICQVLLLMLPVTLYLLYHITSAFQPHTGLDML